jgi:hypothetical protein
MRDPRNGDGTEQIDGDKGDRVDQDVEETDHKEGQNVFQVVAMGSEKNVGISEIGLELSVFLSPSDTFDSGVIELDLDFLSDCIFWICKGL